MEIIIIIIIIFFSSPDPKSEFFPVNQLIKKFWSYAFSLSVSEMGDVKQLLNTWCAKNKTTPNYEYGQSGAKHRPRFKCEVKKDFLCKLIP